MSTSTPRVIFDNATDVVNYVNSLIMKGWRITQSNETHVYLSKSDCSEKTIIIFGGSLKCSHCKKPIKTSLRDTKIPRRPSRK